jgi:signal recognition particle receptor subunit beta
MVQFNFSERTIKAKVVYYGPAQSGKTTNLEQIHRLTDPQSQNRLISLNTAQDRTLFFDLLPFSLGAVSGYDFKVQLYTVPGQVQYNATRRVVLAGADAVVFVADSRKSMFKENLSAFENMKVNLLANRLVPEKVPLVVQYNKRDLEDIQAEAEMRKALNPWARREFPAVASQGQGVLEVFVAVVQEMLAAIAVKYNLKEKGLDPLTIPEVVGDAFDHLLREAQALGPPPPATAKPTGKVIIAQSTSVDHAAPLQATPETGLVSEELLHRSIRSNVELAEALAGLVQQMNLGLGTILSHAELLMMYREDAREKRHTAITSIQQEAARLRKIMQDLGQAGLAAGAAPPPARSPVAAAAPATPAPAPAAERVATAAAPPAPAAAPAPSASLPPAATPAATSGPPLAPALTEAVAAARPTTEPRQVSVELRIPAGATLPRVQPQVLHKAAVALLDGVSIMSPSGSKAVLRSEKKPVLLRGRDGQQVKRDFLMLAISHGGSLTPEDQQRILQGGDSSRLGEACRLVREMGGFVRFAPLPAGGLETRLFLPA